MVRTRILVGASLLAFSLGLLYADHVTGYAFGAAVLVAIAMVGGMAELLRMGEGEEKVPGPVRLIAYACGFFTVVAQVAENHASPPFDLEKAVLGAAAVALLAYYLSGSPTRARFDRLALVVFGIFWLHYVGGYVLRVRYLPGSIGSVPLPPLPERFGETALLYLVLVGKGTDIFAFFSGRFLGVRKLIPNISPGKTVAGGVGGLVGAVLITLAFARFTPLAAVLPWHVALPLGIVVGVAVEAGDLVESFVKRSTAVKDSGALFPEFGGILDVVDCVVFAAPVVYYLLIGCAALAAERRSP